MAIDGCAHVSEPTIKTRIATLADADPVTAVLEASYTALLAGHYDAALLVRALPAMTRANPRLLGSGKYYVAEVDDHLVVACGGWSFERPGTGELVDGLAHVRHFGTHPQWVGRGIARAILSRCINDAAAQGVQVMETYSTFAAVNFYRALGFDGADPIGVPMAPGVTFPSVLMKLKVNGHRSP